MTITINDIANDDVSQNVSRHAITIPSRNPLKDSNPVEWLNQSFARDFQIANLSASFSIAFHPKWKLRIIHPSQIELVYVKVSSRSRSRRRITANASVILFMRSSKEIRHIKETNYAVVIYESGAKHLKFIKTRRVRIADGGIISFWRQNVILFDARSCRTLFGASTIISFFLSHFPIFSFFLFFCFSR